MSAWKRWKESIGDTRPWHVFDEAKHTSPEIAAERYSICEQCPFFVQTTKQCTKCGCFMKLKTMLEDAKCPVGMW